MTPPKAGQILEHAIRSRNINISDLSRRMQINRRTLYNCFNRDMVSMKLVCSIGRAINYDFAEEFKEEFSDSRMKIILGDVDHNLIVKDQSNECVWMGKYIVLLENYISLVKESNQAEI